MTIASCGTDLVDFARMDTSKTLNEARAAAERKDFAEAERLLRQVLASDADSVPALDLLGFVLYFMGQAVEAEAVCRRTLELRPNHAYALKGLGLCVAKQGRLDEGVKHLEAAIARSPRWFDPYWDLAITLADAGRWAQAIQVVEQARGAMPERQQEWDTMERHVRTSGARARS